MPAYINKTETETLSLFFFKWHSIRVSYRLPALLATPL